MKEQDFIIRPIKITDAEAFLNLRIQTEKETEMMAFRSGERKETVTDFTKKLQRNIDSKLNQIFVAEQEGTLVGFVMIYGKDMKVYSKSRGIAMAVAKKYWRQGIGKALLKHAIDWSRTKKVHRLELDVFAHNNQAALLYKKLGFKKEGVQKDGAFIKGGFIDIIGMGLILS